MIQGVLFDMDGILFDTERMSTEVCEEILRGLGYAIPPTLRERTCGSNHVSYRHAILELFPGIDFDAYNAATHKEMYRRLEDKGVPKKPGLELLLGWLKKKGYPMAIASSTRYATILSLLGTAGIRGYFSAIVGGDMVQNSKPHPEPFLKAAEALGLPPESCVAVEDSANGVRSAAAAGCVTIMVPDLLPPTAELRGLAAAVLPSLTEIPAFIEQYNQR